MQRPCRRSQLASYLRDWTAEEPKPSPVTELQRSGQLPALVDLRSQSS